MLISSKYEEICAPHVEELCLIIDNTYTRKEMKIIFNCFSKILSQISRDDCLHYVPEILLPLYKVCEGFSGKVIPDDINRLAEEVRETIKDTIGIQNLVQVYSEIRKNLKVKRDKRKQEEKVMAVVNTMRNAKRKLRIAAKHRANKKRKIMTNKNGEMGSPETKDDVIYNII